MSSNGKSNKYNMIDTQSLIAAFGGIRPMAQKLNIAVSTIQGWKTRNHIPPSRMEKVLDVARAEDINISSLFAPDTPVTIEGEAIILDDKSTKSPKATVEEESVKTNAEKKPEPSALKAVEMNGGNRIAWLALILVIAVGVGLLSRPAWGPVLDPKTTPYLEKFFPMLNKKQAGNEIEALPNGLVDRITALEQGFSSLSAHSAVSGESDDVTDKARGAIDAIDNRLMTLEQGLKSLKASNTGGAVVDLSAVNEKLASLEAAQARLERLNITATDALDTLSHTISKTQDLVDMLNKKFESIEHKQDAARLNAWQAPNQQAATLIVSISQLEDNILSGGDYAPALRNVKALAQDNLMILKDIELLEAYGSQGVATRLDLIRKFSILAPNAEATFRKANAQDWVDETLENIRSLVSIRKIGDEPDLPPVSRAEAALSRDDLEAAIKAASEIPEIKPVKDWLVEAEKRLAAENALLNLRTIAIDMLVNANVDSRVDTDVNISAEAK